MSKSELRRIAAMKGEAVPEFGGDALLIRINEYLGNGGLFNPEYMNHDAVSDLLIACRDRIASKRRRGGLLREAMDYLLNKANRHDLNWRDAFDLVARIDAELKGA